MSDIEYILNNPPSKEWVDATRDWIAGHVEREDRERAMNTPTMTIPVELCVEILDLLCYPKDFEPKDFEGAAESLEGFLRHYKDVK